MGFWCTDVNKHGRQCNIEFKTEHGLRNHRVSMHGYKFDSVCHVHWTPGIECRGRLHRGRAHDHNKAWHSNIPCKFHLCDLTFPHRQLMLNHVQEEHADGAADCKLLFAPGRVCGRRIKQVPSHLGVSHKRVWHSRVKCDDPKCEQHFDNRVLMQDHYDEVHRQEWRCKNRNVFGCAGKFGDKETKLFHEATCDSSQRNIVCGYNACTTTFRSPTGLRLHLYIRHSLSVTQANDFLKEQADDDSEDDESEEEEEEEEEKQQNKSKRLKQINIQIPTDTATGEEFKIFKFGRPNWIFTPLDYGYFWVFYHYGLRLPILTYHVVFPALHSPQLRKTKELRPKNILTDKSLLKIHRRPNNHFRYSGFQRGHLVPYHDFALLPEVGKRTCILSNVLPMRRNFNGGVWKRIENVGARFADQHVVTIQVNAGFFNDPCTTVGPKHLPIPDRFAKVMLGLDSSSNKWDLLVYSVPHSEFYAREDPISPFLGSLDDIQKELQLELFPLLKQDQRGTVNDPKYEDEEEAEEQPSARASAGIIDIL